MRQAMQQKIFFSGNIFSHKIQQFLCDKIVSKAAVFGVLLFFAAPHFLVALSYNQLGWQLKQEQAEDNSYSAELLDTQGMEIFIRSSTKPTEAELKKMFAIYEKAKLWQKIQVRQFRFTSSDGTIEALVVLQKFASEHGKNILPYLPSGLSFTYADTLQYNFRLKIEKLFVRIRGSYSKETELIQKVTEAVDNPHAYIRKRDPEYFLQQLDRLSQDIDKLKTENIALRKQMETYRRGYMALHNEGFFSGPTAINDSKIQKVLEIKKQNPGIKKDKIKEILEKQKIEISSKELTIILLVYFNEAK